MTRRPAVLLLALLPACSPPAAEREDARLRAAIDSIARFYLSIDPTPGLSIAVVRGDDTLLMEGYGLADVEAGTPVTTATVFSIGSITKSFTAAAVMRLVEDGRIALDDTLGELLPEYDGPGRSATLHHLLNHTSGIPTYARFLPGYLDAPEPKRTRAEMLAWFAGRPPDFAPGEDFGYSNSGYYLLGLVVERASGATYGDYVHRTLLRPAGLARTGLCAALPDSAPMAKGYVRGMGGAREAPAENMSNHGGAGAMCGTAGDLVRWIRALEGGTAVSPASYARMTDTASAPTWDGSRVGYGLMMREMQGHRVVLHGGSVYGFTTIVVHLPDDALTIAVLANGPMPAGTIAGDVTRAVLGIERPRWD